MRISDWSSDVCSSDLDLIIIGGERGEKARPPHPMWIRNIEKAARTWNIPVFFRGWGSLRPVVKPDLENDQTLVIVSIDGYHRRSEEHTSELQSLMRISYAVFCLKNTKNTTRNHR